MLEILFDNEILVVEVCVFAVAVICVVHTYMIYKINKHVSQCEDEYAKEKTSSNPDSTFFK